MHKILRRIDAGSCNGCELEIHAVNNPYYNLEGLGMRFVASPRHADLLLVTGPVSRNMEEALRRNVAVPGCPPQPAAILQGILSAVMNGRRSWTASR